MLWGFTFGRESNRENSVVLMLTERGLILNLQTKTQTPVRKKQSKKTKNKMKTEGRADTTVFNTLHGRGTRQKRVRDIYIPFCQEIQGLQRGRVQGEDSNLYRDHWRGRILQHERLYLKQKSPPQKDVSFLSAADRHLRGILKIVWAAHLALIDGCSTKVQR